MSNGNHYIDPQLRDRIQPLGALVLQANEHIVALDDDALREMRRAMRAVGRTNIGWSSYRAAQAFGELVEDEIRHRQDLAAKAAAGATE